MDQHKPPKQGSTLSSNQSALTEQRQALDPGYYGVEVDDLTVRGAPTRHAEVACAGWWNGTTEKVLNLPDVMAAVRYNGGCVVLHGPRGRGKTQTAVWYMVWALAYGNRSCRYVRAAELFIDIRATFGEHAQSTEQDRIDYWSNKRCLVIDELEGTKWSEWESDKFALIFDKRYSQPNFVTLLITNLTPEVLVNDYLPRSVASRLQEVGVFAEVNGPDMRLCNDGYEGSDA